MTIMYTPVQNPANFNGSVILYIYRLYTRRRSNVSHCSASKFSPETELFYFRKGKRMSKGEERDRGKEGEREKEFKSVC